MCVFLYISYLAFIIVVDVSQSGLGVGWNDRWHLVLWGLELDRGGYSPARTSGSCVRALGTEHLAGAV